MASVEMSSAASSLASSLAPTEVPIKLRCAICNNLAVMAFRLPCCDQSICESCQDTLPASCPVCEHTPLSKEDCKPNKPLRTTIMVFLRTEKKKREMLEGQADNTNPSTPTSASIPTDSGTNQTAAFTNKSPEHDSRVGSSVSNDKASAQHIEPQLGTQSVENQVLLSEPINECTADLPEQASSAKPAFSEISEKAVEQDQGGGAKDGEKFTGENGTREETDVQSSQWGVGQVPQPLMGPAGAGFDASAAGFSNMGWNGQGDFSTMMNPMNNVMPNAGWGAFPNMMGMPGMNMDPMAMTQGMYGGGFRGQGMDISGMGGMNGMNMGLGMGFNAGQSGYDGGWSGQSTWNGSQDKYNPNTIGGSAGGMVGDFGANSGFPPPTGGYNLQTHGNYSQIPQAQYQNNDYQDNFRGQGYFPRGGRGRGRGYGYASRGRGGYGYGYEGNNVAFQQQLPPQYQQQGDLALQQPGFGIEVAPLANGTDSVSNLQSAGSVTPKGPGNIQVNENEMPETESEAKTLVEPILDTAAVEVSGTDGGNENSAIERSVPEQALLRPDADATTIGDQNGGIMENGTNEFAPPPLGPVAAFQGQVPQDFSPRARGGVMRGAFRGGQDVRGGFRGKGAGMWHNSSGSIGHSPNQVSPVGQFPVIAPTEPKPIQGLGVPGAPSAPKALREGYANRGRGRSGFSVPMRGGFEGRGGFAGPIPTGPKSEEAAPRPRTQSRSRSRSTDSRDVSHRRNRRRSRTRSVDDSEREKRQERRHRHSHREKGEENGETHIRDAKDTSDSTPVERSGSRSPTPSGKRSSHRSSRYDKEKDRRNSHRHRDSHRSHRERSRERDRDRERSRDRSKERRRRRRRSRSPEDLDVSESVARAEPETTGSQDIKTAVDRDRKGPRESHSSRQRDRKPRSGRERSESPKPDTPNNDRRNNHTVRRRDDASSSVATSPTIREIRDKPETVRESNRNDRKPRERGVPPPKPVPEEDPHNREREERNRERLLKEQQRREELNKERERKDLERKRGRAAVEDDDAGAGDDGDEDRHRHRRHKRHRQRNIGGANEDVSAGGQERQRRLSYKYEDEESDEARAQRVENEREAARWG